MKGMNLVKIIRICLNDSSLANNDKNACFPIYLFRHLIGINVFRSYLQAWRELFIAYTLETGPAYGPLQAYLAFF